MELKQSIHESITFIMDSLREQGQASGTLKNYQTYFHVFEKYLSENNITYVDESVCLEYVYLKTGMRLKSFEGKTLDPVVNRRMKPLHLLLMYLENGKFHYHQRKLKESFQCPKCFQEEYETFCEECIYRGYSQATIDTNKQKLQLLLEYLVSQEVTSSSEIIIQHVENFLRTYNKAAVKYVGIFLYVLRNYFTFLYDRGYITEDITRKLPKIRTMRNSSIPYVWKKEDIQKLLNAVDREDPKGKRDYAILLIAIRLGLRISDIRRLKLVYLNWNRKTISLKMCKTSQMIELPLLDDIGWAIIDYLKHGRPSTNSDCLFVRHRPPFNAFGDRSNFNKELHRYIIKAGLNISGDALHGMHSLRSTLAGNMLEVKAPLPVISETLGHQNINTTSIYLKVDIESLRKCALDPEEVFVS